MSIATLEQSIDEKYPKLMPHQAVIEAERCLYCFDPPCVKACPTSIDIPRFIKSIATKDTLSAAATIMHANVLGYSCAKVCPVEVLCQGSCVYVEKEEPAIAIGRLQHFAMDYALTKCTADQIMKPEVAMAKKIAVVGSGPASITVAVLLARAGVRVDVFEQRDFLGGLNAAGIAPYKLKHEEAEAEIAWLSSPLIQFHRGISIAEAEGPKSRSAQSLEQQYDALFLGFGLGDGKLPQEVSQALPNVWDAYDLIEAIKTDPGLDLSWVRHATIIGGGNSAIDIAHIVRKLGIPYVAMRYRGYEKDASSYAHELDAAKKSGVHFFERQEVKEIVSENNKLKGFIERWSNQLIETDFLIFAIGQKPLSKTARLFSGVEIDGHGLVVVDTNNYRTHNEKIWSAGDCVNGGKEVVYAVAEAKIAAKSILEFLKVSTRESLA